MALICNRKLLIKRGGLPLIAISLFSVLLVAITIHSFDSMLHDEERISHDRASRLSRDVVKHSVGDNLEEILNATRNAKLFVSSANEVSSKFLEAISGMKQQRLEDSIMRYMSQPSVGACNRLMEFGCGGLMRTATADKRDVACKAGENFGSLVLCKDQLVRYKKTSSCRVLSVGLMDIEPIGSIAEHFHCQVIAIDDRSRLGSNPAPSVRLFSVPTSAGSITWAAKASDIGQPSVMIIRCGGCEWGLLEEMVSSKKNKAIMKEVSTFVLHTTGGFPPRGLTALASLIEENDFVLVHAFWKDQGVGCSRRETPLIFPKTAPGCLEMTFVRRSETFAYRLRLGQETLEDQETSSENVKADIRHKSPEPTASIKQPPSSQLPSTSSPIQPRHPPPNAAAAKHTDRSCNLPLVDFKRVLKLAAGQYSNAMVIENSNGKKIFLKSKESRAFDNLGKLTRYANLEAELLTSQIFKLMSVQSPDISLGCTSEDSEIFQKLGDAVMISDFVDSDWANTPVHHGQWLGLEYIDLDSHVDTALVDILTGNADRHYGNYFLIKRPSDGKHVMIPFDHNSAFFTMIVWYNPSNLINFWKTYDGLGSVWPWHYAGTIGTIAKRHNKVRLAHMHILHNLQLELKVFERARMLIKQVSDAVVDDMVASVPFEIFPASMHVDPNPQWLVDLPDSAVKKSAFFSFSNPLHGRQLFEKRTEELRDTLKWRRDHLLGALRQFYDHRKEKEPTHCRKLLVQLEQSELIRLAAETVDGFVARNTTGANIEILKALSRALHGLLSEDSPYILPPTTTVSNTTLPPVTSEAAEVTSEIPETTVPETTLFLKNTRIGRQAKKPEK